MVAQPPPQKTIANNIGMAVTVFMIFGLCKTTLLWQMINLNFPNINFFCETAQEKAHTRFNLIRR